MSRERWIYLLVIAALLVGAASAVQLLLWQRMEAREAELIESLSHAARQAPGEQSAEFARVCTLAEGSCALIDQHVKSSEIVIALATLFFGGIAFAVLSQVKRAASEAAREAVKPVADQMATDLRKRFDVADTALRRMVEYLVSDSPARRQTSLQMAAELGIVEFMGAWREIVCNGRLPQLERQAAVAALRHFKAAPEAEDAADLLAEACLAIYRLEVPQPEDVLRSVIECLAELDRVTDTVRLALGDLSAHPSASVRQAADNTRKGLGLA
jgi:hypothetical protein